MGKWFSASYIIILMAVSSFARSQTGSIAGLVRDVKTRETLVGANVIIKGTVKGTATDIDGKFKIDNLQPGKYTLVISYISYETREVENITVTAGKVTEKEISLDGDLKMLKGAEVVERRKTDTDVSMISSIKQSKLILSGISSQQISRSQDKDASEVIRRVPGISIMEDKFVIVRGLMDRYNTVWLNKSSTPSFESDKRAFSFDVIPSSSIDRMEVYKTPAPELPADFSGASILVFTKNIPEKNTLVVSYSAGINKGTTGGEFYRYTGGKTDFLGFDDGTRALPGGFPDVKGMEYLQYTPDLGDTSITNPLLRYKRAKLTELGRAFRNIWSAKRSTAPINHHVGVELTRKFKAGKVAVGNFTSASYRYAYDRNDIVYSRFYEAADKIDSGYYYNDCQYTATANLGALHNWSLMMPNGLLVEFRNFFNQSGQSRYTFRDGIDYYYSGLKVRSYELAYASRTTYSGQVSSNWNLNDDKTSVIDLTLGYAYARKEEPDIRRIYSTLTEDSSSVYNGLYAVQFTVDANPDRNGRLFLGLKDNIWSASSNYFNKFDVRGISPSLKTGFFFEKRQRVFSARNIGFIKARADSFDVALQYLPFDELYAPDNINYPNGLMIAERTDPPDSYQAASEILALYAGWDVPLGDLIDIYAGVRAEQSRQHLYGFQAEGSDQEDVVLDTLNFFPSVNLTFNLSKKTKIRLTYGKTINRPEFREIAPFSFYDFSSGTQMYGNDTSLRNCYIHNSDLRFEWYPTLEDFMSVGVFYKKFLNPIEYTLLPASTDKWEFQPYNAREAVSLGAEVDIKYALKNMGTRVANMGVLKHLSVVFNASLIDSKVKEQEWRKYKRDKVRPMQWQSPYLINAGLYYYNENKQLMLSALYNIIGERIIFVGDPKTPHTYESPRNLFDLTIQKKFGSRFTVKAGIKDLFNDPVRLYNRFDFDADVDGDGNPDTPINEVRDLKSYKPGALFSFGLIYSIL